MIFSDDTHFFFFYLIILIFDDLESKRNGKSKPYKVAINCCLSISTLVTGDENMTKQQQNLSLFEFLFDVFVFFFGWEGGLVRVLKSSG